jgi:cytochrome b6-f complex iron-sulfur subunit
MVKVNRSRRKFIQVVALVIASATLLWKFLTPRIPQKKPLLRVAKAEVPHGGALVFRKSRIAVIRQGSDFCALRLVCTHLGCTVNITPREMVCPCHGSVFNHGGAVIEGPADRPLEKLTVEKHGKFIVVFG